MDDISEKKTHVNSKDDKLIEEALLVCEGNIDEAIEYINSLKNEEGK